MGGWEVGGMKVGWEVIDETRLAYTEIVQAGWWGHGGPLFHPFSFCVCLKIVMIKS